MTPWFETDGYPTLPGCENCARIPNNQMNRRNGLATVSTVGFDMGMRQRSSDLTSGLVRTVIRSLLGRRLLAEAAIVVESFVGPDFIAHRGFEPFGLARFCKKPSRSSS